MNPLIGITLKQLAWTDDLGPAATWLLRVGPTAKRLNQESSRETALPNKRAVTDQ